MAGSNLLTELKIKDQELNKQGPPAGIRHETGRGRTRIILLSILALLTVVVFFPIVGHEFLAYDDPVNVYKNPYLQSRSLINLLHFWTHPYEGLYAPLIYTLYSLAAWVPGLLLTGNPDSAVAPEAWLYHGLNLFFHLLSVMIVWHLLRLLLHRIRSSRAAENDQHQSCPLEWAAAMGALLFAIHPIQVEAVAWVTGLKDVLYGFFSLAAVWYYLRHIDVKTHPAAGGASSVRTYYGIATAAFVLALTVKPTAVVVPLIVWLLAAWGWQLPWRSQIRGLAVWIILAFAWGLLTRWVQPATLLAFEPPVWTRPLIAGDALMFYLYKLIFPLQFGPDYGRSPQYVLGRSWIYLTGLAPYAFCGWLWFERRQFPWLFAAAGLFILGLLPVLGVIPFGFQRYSTVADRYVYLAILGPALALAWGTTRLKKRTAIICAAVILGLLLLRSIWLVPYWHDSATFFRHALKVNPDSYLAHNNLGFVLAEQGRDIQAIHHFKEALRIEPRSAVTYLNLGNAMDRQGDHQGAIRHYQEALRIVPNYARAHTNIGLSLAKQGQYEEALEHHRKALQIEPRFAEAQLNMANLLAQQGKFEAAGTHYTAAIELNPGNAKAHSNYAAALAMQKRFDAAQRHFTTALGLQPDSAKAHANLAGVLLQQMKLPEAEQHYREAIRINPQYKNAHLRLSTVLAARGKFDGAKYHISEVLRMEPDNSAARQILKRIEYLERTQ